jgi:hypothetical protein
MQIVAKFQGLLQRVGFRLGLGLGLGCRLIASVSQRCACVYRVNAVVAFIDS